MGKLNIAHHKSYHPYRRDNIDRVRRDEEEARQRDAIEDGKMLLADSEARIDLLRQRAGLKNTKRRRNSDADLDAIQGQTETSNAPADAPITITSSNGHINLFEDLERQVIPVRSTKRGPPPENDKGIALAPSAKDLNPWYSDHAHGKSREADDDDKRLRDHARKSVHDPLTSINSQLASRSGAPSGATGRRPFHPTSRPRREIRSDPHAPPSAGDAGVDAEVAARVSRESAERQRALELIRRKKREIAGSDTPSTVRAGPGGYGYGDVFNRREMEDVQRAKRRDRERDRDRARDWVRDRDRDRSGGRSGHT